MLDFDNCQKWLNWIKEKPIYKIWLVSPFLLSIWIGILLHENSELKKEIAPIQRLYPKLELSGAVAKLMGDFQVLNTKVDKVENDSEKNIFKPLSILYKEKLIESVKGLTKEYPNLKLGFIYVLGAVNGRKSAQELTDILREANIPVDLFLNTDSLKEDILLIYGPSTPLGVVKKVVDTFSIIFKFHNVKFAPNDQVGNEQFLLKFSGEPLFDSDGLIFSYDEFHGN